MTGPVRTRMAAYGRVPKALLRDPNISPGAVKTFALLDDVAGHMEVSASMLAAWIGCSERSARRFLYELRDAGWVELVAERSADGHQAANSYILNDYPNSTTPLVEPTDSQLAINDAADLAQADTSDSLQVDTSDNPNTETEKQETKNLEPRARPRATRLPDDWKPSPEDRVWAQTNGFENSFVQHQIELFCNHWWAKSGYDATKISWSLTWHNWLIRARDWEPNGRGNGSNSRFEPIQTGPENYWDK